MRCHGIYVGPDRITLIDSDDVERVAGFTWHSTIKPNGYARVKKEGGIEALSRFIMNEANPKILIDHKNRNTLDNRKQNLRRANVSDNQCNSAKRPGTSVFRGVRRDPKGNKNCWRAQIKKDKKTYYLGMYPTEDAAAIAYDVMASSLHGEFATLNFPPPPQTPAQAPTPAPVSGRVV